MTAYWNQVFSEWGLVNYSGGNTSAWNSTARFLYVTSASSYTTDCLNLNDGRPITASSPFIYSCPNQTVFDPGAVIIGGPQKQTAYFIILPMTTLVALESLRATGNKPLFHG